MMYGLICTVLAFTLGYEYDITREKVPTEATLRRVADIVSSLGYTALWLRQNRPGGVEESLRRVFSGDE